MNVAQARSTPLRTVQQTSGALLGTARTLAYAGLGVVAVLQEEAAETFSRLVREGRAVEAGRTRTLAAHAYAETVRDKHAAETVLTDAATQAERVAEEAVRSAGDRARDLEERLQRAVVAVLQRMNVPTRDDVEALKRSVERLDEKTAQLRSA